MEPTAHRRLAVLQKQFDLHLRLPQQDPGAAAGLFDPLRMQAILDHDNADMRQRTKEFLDDELYIPCVVKSLSPCLTPTCTNPPHAHKESPPPHTHTTPSRCRRYNISMEEERELALARLQRMCRAGLFSITDFRSNPHRIFAAHELATWCVLPG